ncbi:MAG TPA: tRNA uridine-5-carboxymethylaminomethyl(34) synthesis GTPase MnmE, partial [Salinimicrobium sp.]|nr:tRNA uridine-5-carboxymethylaminomethyl(34) synthesis GTPase MnmE [Salinimicrobium sp.]
MKINDIIVALATPSGAGAIAVIRVSGPKCIPLVSAVFKAKSGKDISKVPSHTLHLGQIYDDKRILDEVLVSVFHGPKSYTGEDTV